MRVENVRMFGRTDGEKQILAVAFRVSADAPAALVLPLPVEPGSPERAVTIADLQNCPNLFRTLGDVFDPGLEMMEGARRPGQPRPMEVQTIGVFDVSYVPSPADFSRLDPRFRLPAETWRDAPEYRDYGFAVFQIQPGQSQETVPPVAVEFPTRDPGRIFFPTRDARNGLAPTSTELDIDLYYQRDLPDLRAHAETEPRYVERAWYTHERRTQLMKECGRAWGPWLREQHRLRKALGDEVSWHWAGQQIGHWGGIVSSGPANHELLASVAGVVDYEAYLLRRRLKGRVQNADTWIPC